jgi:hypothetical protein
MEQDFQDIAKSARPTQPPKEGSITKTIELYTAKLPSMTWLWLAVGSMAISAGFAAAKERKGTANFIGLWAPSLLLIGIYNKLVKMEQSNKFDRGSLH